MADLRTKNLKLAKRLLLSGCLMFGFGFALVPLYDIFCEVTGLNGKLINIGEPKVEIGVDKTRTIKVQLLAVNNVAMPWGFAANTAEISVYPGEQKMTAYTIQNRTNNFMVGQAVPSISPSEAAPYLHKINCFCFNEQPLNSKETKQMPLLFTVSPDLPAHIHTISLSYTLFDITPKS